MNPGKHGPRRPPGPSPLVASFFLCGPRHGKEAFCSALSAAYTARSTATQANTSEKKQKTSGVWNRLKHKTGKPVRTQKVSNRKSWGATLMIDVCCLMCGARPKWPIWVKVSSCPQTVGTICIAVGYISNSVQTVACSTILESAKRGSGSKQRQLSTTLNHWQLTVKHSEATPKHITAKSYLPQRFLHFSQGLLAYKCRVSKEIPFFSGVFNHCSLPILHCRFHANLQWENILAPLWRHSMWPFQHLVSCAWHPRFKQQTRRYTCASHAQSMRKWCTLKQQTSVV